MENLQKALIMAGSVFMFIIALSVAVYSYTVITDVIDTILTTSDSNARSAEYFVANTVDTTRYSTKAEVVMTILSMEGNDFTASKVLVDGFAFEKSSFSTVEGRNKIEANISNKVVSKNYEVSYDLSDTANPIVIFKTAVI